MTGREIGGKIFFALIFYLNEASRGTKCDCEIDWLWVRSPLEEMIYLFRFIFYFFRSGDEAMRGVEFRHSTRNVSRTRRKVRNGVS